MMEKHKCEFTFNGKGLRTLVKETNLSENAIVEVDDLMKNAIKPFLSYVNQKLLPINMDISIYRILDVRTYNVLSRQGFKTSGDIISELRCNPEFYMFKNIKGLGNVSYMETIYCLDHYFGVTSFFKTYILPKDIELFKKHVSSHHPYAYEKKVLSFKEKYDFLTCSV